MTGALEIVAALLFAYLVVVVPLRGRSRYERFRREVAEDSSARLRYYRSSLLWKYALSLVVVVLFLANDQEAAGIRLVRPRATTIGYMLPIMIGIGLGAVLIHWRSRRSASRVRFARSIRGFADLLPRTAAERRAWMLVSITAGVTEELLYRGFVLWVLAQLMPSVDTFTLLVIGGLIFGFGHLYQGAKGIALTALLGVVLGEVVIAAGLLAAMAVHTLIDLRVLLIPSDLATQPA